MEMYPPNIILAIVIVKPHPMHAAYCYRCLAFRIVCITMSVSLCVGYTAETCKNG